MRTLLSRFIVFVIMIWSVQSYAGFYIERSSLHEEMNKSGKPQMIKGTAFYANAGDIFNEKLKEWASRNGYVLVWEIPSLRTGAPITIDGTPDEVLNHVSILMEESGMPVSVRVYSNGVIRVSNSH